MCCHCFCVVMNRITIDENMRKISILLVKSYDAYIILSCTDQLEGKKTHHLFLWSSELAETLQRAADISHKLSQQKINSRNKFLHKC